MCVCVCVCVFILAFLPPEKHLVDSKTINRRNLWQHNKGGTRIRFKVKNLNMKPKAKVTNLNAYHVLGE